MSGTFSLYLPNGTVEVFNTEKFVEMLYVQHLLNLRRGLAVHLSSVVAFSSCVSEVLASNLYGKMAAPIEDFCHFSQPV
jgi:hypothetical protein